MASRPAIDILAGMKLLDFPAFLDVTGEDDLAQALREASVEELDREQKRLEDALETYCFVGGIPSVVELYRKTRDFAQVRDLQQQILAEIERTILQSARAALAGHALQVWRSAALQLTEENKKFFFNAAGQGGRSRTHELAIDWLVDSGLFLRVYRVTEPIPPLAEQIRPNAFKLYLFDVGLLAAALQIEAPEPGAERLFAQYNAALAENFACQQLLANGVEQLYCWNATNTLGQIDFLLEQNGIVIPIEVQGVANRRSKNLAAFLQRFGTPGGVRLLPDGFDDRGQIAEVPLYAASILVS